MMGRSFKPSLSLRPRRPSIARTSSTSSTKSVDCPSPLSAPFTAAATSEGLQLSTGPAPTPDSPRAARTRPIAIELPARKRTGLPFTPTPPEPLSARGDLLGGYFPLHEDFQRSYKTHPFNTESSTIKASSFTNKTMAETRPPTYPPRGQNRMIDGPQLAENVRLPPAAADPLLMSMPLGKYHPSNYKNKSSTLDKVATAPTSANQPHHARKKSDIKKKLQQYQRDMVQQAAISGRMPLPGKPTSPRLIPLTSPGPVTPMELEESAEYLGAGSRDVDPQELAEWMSRAVEKRSNRGRSPSPSGFAGRS